MKLKSKENLLKLFESQYRLDIVAELQEKFFLKVQPFSSSCESGTLHCFPKSHNKQVRLLQQPQGADNID